MEKNNLKKEDVVDFEAILSAIIIQKKVIFITTFIFVFFGVVFSLLVTPQYNCTTKFSYELPSSSKMIGSLSSLAAMAGLGGASSSDNMLMFLDDIINSKDFLEPILDSAWQIDELSDSTAKLHEIWDLKPDSTENFFQRTLTLQSLKEIRKHMAFSIDKSSNLMSFTTSFKTPYLSYQINEYVVTKINETLLASTTNKSHLNRIFIEERLGEAKDVLLNSENKLKLFRDRNHVLTSAFLILEQARLQRELEIEQEIFIQLRKQYELARIEEQKDLPAVTVIDMAYIPVERDFPKRKLIVILTFIIGTFIGFIVAILREWYLVNNAVVKRIFKAKPKRKL